MNRPTCPSAGRGYENDSRSPSSEPDDACPECGGRVDVDVNSDGDGQIFCLECDYSVEVGI